MDRELLMLVRAQWGLWPGHTPPPPFATGIYIDIFIQSLCAFRHWCGKMHAVKPYSIDWVNYTTSACLSSKSKSNGWFMRTRPYCMYIDGASSQLLSRLWGATHTYTLAPLCWTQHANCNHITNSSQASFCQPQHTHTRAGSGNNRKYTGNHIQAACLGAALNTLVIYTHEYMCKRQSRA